MRSSTLWRARPRRPAPSRRASRRCGSISRPWRVSSEEPGKQSRREGRDMSPQGNREPTIHELFDLTGKVVLLTGGAGFLGSAMSRALAEAGASVVLTSRDASRARTAAEALPRPGAARHHGIALDHMDPLALERGFAEALAPAGKLDVLVHTGNARP